MLDRYRDGSQWRVMEEGYWYQREDDKIRLWCSAIPAIGVAYVDFLAVMAEYKKANSLKQLSELPDVTWAPNEAIFELQRKFIEDQNAALREFASRSEKNRRLARWSARFYRAKPSCLRCRERIQGIERSPGTRKWVFHPGHQLLHVEREQFGVGEDCPSEGCKCGFHPVRWSALPFADTPYCDEPSLDIPWIGSVNFASGCDQYRSLRRQ